MKILITGGFGFIGSSLIRKIEKNNEIFVIDNFDRNQSVKSITSVDITNFKEVYNAVNSFCPDIIIHLAALCGVDNVINRPIRTMEVNMIGAYNLLHTCKNLKLKKFLNFSTSEVYGSYSYKLGEDEKTSLGDVGEARWSYSVSKLAAEHLCFAFQKECGIPIISIRPFNIYGPGQIGDGALYIFLRKALKNEEIFIHGDGSQIRSWCYIDDAVDFIISCIEKDEANNNVFNMGNPESTVTTLGLAEKIIEITNSKSKLTFIDIPYKDVDLRIPNIEKAKKILNFKPMVNLSEGIIKTSNWILSENK